MTWGSWSEFFSMGGYGFYVWTSFGATALCLAWEVLMLWRRHVAAVRRPPSITQATG